jgi:glucoamylase
MHDSGWTDGDWLVASDADKTSALTITKYGLDDSTNGYLGTSDGLTQLRRSGSTTRYNRAAKGNVVQMARIRFPLGLPRSSERFTVVLSFGRNQEEAISNGQASMRKDFELAKTEYARGWHDYFKTLPRIGKKYQAQFNMAAMVLKALEDKTYRGAMIASPSNPWGGGANANEATISGYHAVWSRDLYHVATAFLALGDTVSANRALDYLFKVQQRPDGSFPQNSWVDGRPIGGGLQLDQVGLPLVLAYQLQRNDRQTWLKHIKPAADFIVRKGPITDQERWEEKRGYSPSTIAAEIAGLVCAAHIARINRDTASADRYLKTADEWAQRLEDWTATSSGPHLKESYFIRITQDANPNDGDKIEINSGGGVYDEREIVDAGFLELVRLGIKAADNPLIVRTLRVVDKLIKVETPGGPGWYRYNHDAYGERPDGGNYDGRTGVGRLWALLTGERGEYEIARGDSVAARTRLDTMLSFANDGMMIPEQVWDRRDLPEVKLRYGEGTGAATPLAWSMAQFIRLALNSQNGKNLETPRVVADRYVNKVEHSRRKSVRSK